MTTVLSQLSIKPNDPDSHAPRKDPGTAQSQQIRRVCAARSHIPRASHPQDAPQGDGAGTEPSVLQAKGRFNDTGGPTCSEAELPFLYPASTLSSQALWRPRAFPERTLCLGGRVESPAKCPGASDPHPTATSRPSGPTGRPAPLPPSCPQAPGTPAGDRGLGLRLPAPRPPTQMPGAPGSLRPLAAAQARGGATYPGKERGCRGDSLRRAALERHAHALPGLPGGQARGGASGRGAGLRERGGASEAGEAGRGQAGPAGPELGVARDRTARGAQEFSQSTVRPLLAAATEPCVRSSGPSADGSQASSPCPPGPALCLREAAIGLAVHALLLDLVRRPLVFSPPDCGIWRRRWRCLETRRQVRQSRPSCRSRGDPVWCLQLGCCLTASLEPVVIGCHNRV